MNDWLLLSIYPCLNVPLGVRYKVMTVYACSLSVRCVGVLMEPRLVVIDKTRAKPGGHDVGDGHF